MFKTRLGVWGEYSWNKICGARVGILLDSGSTGGLYNMISSSTYFTIPILLTSRLDPERKSCFFGGVQLGYRSAIQAHEVEELRQGKDRIGRVPGPERLAKLKNKLVGFGKDKTSPFQVGLVAGVDFEFSSGLTLGLYGVKYLIDPGKGTCYEGWDLHPSWSILPTLGYNAARLFQ